MDNLLKPIKMPSAKEMCIARMEELILSGKLAIGEKLPPERDIAEQLEVSRPVVHECLVDLASKGLVRLVPRVGTFINDYLREGSLNLLTSLLGYHKGQLSSKLLEDVLGIRKLIEIECARLAALNRTQANLKEFHQLLEQENKISIEKLWILVDLHFKFHHQVALSTDNFGFPLLLNSFKPLYVNLLHQYFSSYKDKLSTVIESHKSFHLKMVDAIQDKNPEKAMEYMDILLKIGRAQLNS